LSSTIDGEAAAAGLPPPLLMSVTDASQLAFVLRAERGASSVVQLLASRNGEGVSTLTRDLCLVSASNGYRTLLFAAEAPGRRVDWPRSIYGMPSGLRPLGGPPALEIVQVGETRLSLAAPLESLPLQAQSWVPIIAELRASFDFIVIDTPALSRSYTGIMLAPLIDTTAVVVAAESTRASMARNLRDRLAEAGGDTAGVILNKRRFYVPRAAYDRL
jgi:Mrp family chromosome partitioning ATPase